MILQCPLTLSTAHLSWNDTTPLSWDAYNNQSWKNIELYPHSTHTFCKESVSLMSSVDYIYWGMSNNVAMGRMLGRYPEYSSASPVSNTGIEAYMLSQSRTDYKGNLINPLDIL